MSDAEQGPRPLSAQLITQTDLDEFARTHFRRVGRVRDVKWFAGTIATIFAAIYAIGIYFAVSAVNQERESLEKRFDALNAATITELDRTVDRFKDEREAREKFEKELREHVEGKIDESNLAFYSINNGYDLSHQQIHSDIVETPGDIEHFVFKLKFIARNIGKSSTGPMWYKLLTNNPFVTDSENADKDGVFDYQNGFSPANLNNNDIPGQFSTIADLELRFEAAEIPKKGKPYPAKIKAYYGNGKSSFSDIYLVADNDFVLEPLLRVGPVVPPIGLHDLDPTLPKSMVRFYGIWSGEHEQKWAVVAITQITNDGHIEAEYWRQLREGGKYEKADVSRGRIVNNVANIEYVDERGLPDRIYFELYENNTNEAHAEFFRITDDQKLNVTMEFRKQ